MNDQITKIAEACLKGAETDTMTFPSVIQTLMSAGIESYSIDFRRSAATYYLPDGVSFQLQTHHVDVPVAATLDTSRLKAAISEAQQQVEGYTYTGFCKKAASAGCAFYSVSFSGRRALYVGRDSATHVELFPN